VRIDETQRGWAIASLAILALAIITYAIYAANAVDGPRGGSPMGLTFGVVGFAFMLFAALLGARKRVPTWRLGRAQAWMRGHLWLGLLSLPMILFHGGFHFGGVLTNLLMWLLIITVLSGLLGAFLQHYLPRAMTADVKLETIYDEIDNVRGLLREEADRTVEGICGSLGLQTSDATSVQRAGGFTGARPIPVRGGAAAIAVAEERIALSREDCAPLKAFYLEEMRPFLKQPRSRQTRLASADKARTAFEGLKTLIPSAAHEALDDLADICDEARQLVRQEQLHRWLHGWLLVHIPISLALIFLGAVHAVMALRF
jgi:hypothetical protein